MGERKGTNKYYPPDYDPKKGGLNKFLGTHALRERARKIDKGIIIIRFEMPYNIWCEGCKNHIGMGVRYNAEKTKVGMYYTTPVYQFKMKCHLCDNHFVIKADPANLDYVILSGARRQENRWDPLQNEQVVPETKETQKKLFDDSMFKLEHGAQDKGISESAKPRLVKLFNRNEDTWSDSYTANQKLREQFRKKNYEQKTRDKVLLKKYNLDIPILEEQSEDKKTAALLCVKSTRTLEENCEEKRKKIVMESSLPMTNFSKKKEETAVKILNRPKADLGIVKKGKTSVITTRIDVKTTEIEKNITNTDNTKDEKDSVELENDVSTREASKSQEESSEISKNNKISAASIDNSDVSSDTLPSCSIQQNLANVGIPRVSLVGDYGVSSSSDSDS